MNRQHGDQEDQKRASENSDLPSMEITHPWSQEGNAQYPVNGFETDDEQPDDQSTQEN